MRKGDWDGVEYALLEPSLSHDHVSLLSSGVGPRVLDSVPDRLARLLVEVDLERRRNERSTSVRTTYDQCSTTPGVSASIRTAVITIACVIAESPSCRRDKEKRLGGNVRGRRTGGEGRPERTDLESLRLGERKVEVERILVAVEERERGMTCQHLLV